MDINSKRQVVATCEELLNHKGWKERINLRRKIKGHGNRIFRTFELDCGNGYMISIGITEAIGFSLASCEFTKPYIATIFQTTYGHASPRMTKITDCTNRSEFERMLYNTLAKQFPLTDFDVQEVKVD